MNNENYLLLLYGYYPAVDNQEGSYKLMKVVDERGMVDDQSLADALVNSLGKDLSSNSNQTHYDLNEDIYFKGLEELNKFAYKLMNDLDAPLICVLSAENYNTCMEKCSSLEEFKDLLLDSSNCLENVDYSKDKGLLSKIFN
ncbi:MAG: hypothetical protein HN576_11395 [Bacteriovoracaceae bacterium]|jgi:hypothetical protein|nr:hypothetical protein [Bacteriovoracaceae bacterium]